MRIYLWNKNWYHWYIEATTSLTIERLSYFIEKKIVNVVFGPDQWILFFFFLIFVGSESTSGNISTSFVYNPCLSLLSYAQGWPVAKFFLHLQNIDILKDVVWFVIKHLESHLLEMQERQWR